METYISFLRGVNVGGKNKISMSELKAELEKNGFTDVLTYINSGNIIFTSDNINEQELKENCETIIINRFQLNISVAIINAKELIATFEHAPFWWNADTNSKHNAIFVIPPTTVEEVCKEVGEIKPEYEQVEFYNRVIFWSAPRGTFSRTRWSKVSSTSVYNRITIRNANTVNKIIQLVK